MNETHMRENDNFGGCPRSSPAWNVAREAIAKAKGVGQFAVWLEFGDYCGHLRSFDNHNDAFFWCLNVPGTQDFTASMIVHNGERIRRYTDWRNRGFKSPEEADKASRVGGAA